MPKTALALAETDIWELEDEGWIADEWTTTLANQRRLSLVPPAPSVEEFRYVAEFEGFADELSEAATVVSNTRRLMIHPAFGAILALGKDAVPLVLKRLAADTDNRAIWLRLLGTLEGERPGVGVETIAAASEIWLQWGRRQGYRC